jgi:hypothetical protein
MLNALAPSFPREVAFPWRMRCENKEIFYKQINNHNGLKNVYYSLYDASGVIDKVGFDYDSLHPEQLVGDLQKASDYLIKKNLKHTIMFSGKKGFHLYVFCKITPLKNPKDALKNFQLTFEKETETKPDPQLYGDVRRVLRVPNTFHLGGSRYCIPITREDLEKGFAHIHEKAKKQSFKFESYGKELLSLEEFDCVVSANWTDIPEYDGKLDLSQADEMVKFFPPCLQHWLLNVNEAGTWQARYQFALFCRDFGLSRADCHSLAKKYFGSVGRTDNLANNYEHMVKVKAIDFAYTKGEIMMGCDKLWINGLCPGKCKDYCANLFPIYR